MFKKNIFNVIELTQLRLWSMPEVKTYLRVSHDYDDEIIRDLIISAIDSAENFLGLSLHQRKIEFICNLPGRQTFDLKFKPIIEISEMTMTTAKLERKLTSDEYYFDKAYYTLYLKQALAGDELKVTYIAGYTNDEIPNSIKQGILLHICAMYDRDSDGSLALSNEIKNLYFPYRKIRL